MLVHIIIGAFLVLIFSLAAFYTRCRKLQRAIKSFLDTRTAQLETVRRLREQNLKLSLRLKKDADSTHEAPAPLIIIRMESQSEYLYSALKLIGVELDDRQKLALERSLKSESTIGFRD